MSAANGFFKSAAGFVRKRPIITAGFVTCALRSGVRSEDVRIEYSQPAGMGETNATWVTRGPFLSERVAISVIGGFSFPFILPLLACVNLRKLEVAARGMDPTIHVMAPLGTDTVLGAIVY